MKKDNDAGSREVSLCWMESPKGAEEKREEIADYRAREGRRCGWDGQDGHSLQFSDWEQTV